MLHACLTLTLHLIALAGLGPAIHEPSDQLVVKVVPVQIFLEDQSDLPGTWPMLDVLFALPGGEKGIVVFRVNEAT